MNLLRVAFFFYIEFMVTMTVVVVEIWKRIDVVDMSTILAKIVGRRSVNRE